MISRNFLWGGIVLLVMESSLLFSHASSLTSDHFLNDQPEQLKNQLRGLNIFEHLDNKNCYLAGLPMPSWLCPVVEEIKSKDGCDKDEDEDNYDDDDDDDDEEEDNDDDEDDFAFVNTTNESRKRCSKKRCRKKPCCPGYICTGKKRKCQLADTVLSCPDIGSDPIVVPPSTSVDITSSLPGTLCLLTLKKTSAAGVVESISPVARSYEGNDWESVKGPYNLDITCTSTFCSTTIPALPSSSHTFQLTVISNNDSNINSQNQVSRFLEQATFGATTETISSLSDGASDEQDIQVNFGQWIQNQMNPTLITSHREYFRKHANTRFVSTERVGSPLHPCSPESRWHSYTFNEKDNGSFIQVTKTSDDSAFLLSIDDIPRTEVQSIIAGNSEHLEAGKSYQICNKKGNLAGVIGSELKVQVGSSCKNVIGGNPPIKFASDNPVTPTNTIPLSSSKLSDFLQLPGDNENDDFLLESGLDEPLCSFLHIGAYPVYLDFNNGDWLAFDPRINLQDNTLDNVISDGGGSQALLGAVCSNAPKTFLNIESCTLSSEIEACSARFNFPDTEIPLLDTSLVKLHELTHDYVYAIAGLRPETSPCAAKSRSRWELVDESQCVPNLKIDSETKNTLADLISDADGSNLRDITFQSSRSICNIEATTPSMENIITVQVGTKCWELVHSDHHNVYDMTPWVTKHPGGRNGIKQFATRGEAFLEFPDWHEMWRWDDNKYLFPLLGRFGDSVKYRDLPSNLQLESVAEEFGVEGELNSGEGVLVCGSPGEVKNEHSLGETGYHLRLVDGKDDFSGPYFDKQKLMVWTMIVLSSPDQLRQRVAWALSQILAISPDDVKGFDQTEFYLTYYDIFVRHAFGSYRDILKEVAYSPAMAKMLSYRASKSAAYNWQRFRTINFADENFAREVMQLFSIGTVMLNMDGTPQQDPVTNSPVLSYTNDHIMSFARAWTGFDLQTIRGNIEIFSKSDNMIDPMKIVPEWRDIFPKINLLGGHIGDGYPLCVDMPDRFFLRKGAKYRLLGSSTILELQSNPAPTIDARAKSVSLSSSSQLYNKLCNPTNERGDDCTWQNEVVLDENISCNGQECSLDTLRLVQVTDSVFYEYVQPPCVQLPYYDNPKKISTSNNMEIMCADPRSISASEACCTPNDIFARDRNCEYVGERMSYNLASERCHDIGQHTCSFNKMKGCNSVCCSWVENYFWQDETCLLQVKVDEAGYAAIVHKVEDTDDSMMRSFVQNDSVNFFPVYWDEDYPSPLNNCGMGKCQLLGDSCICNIEIVETSVFTSMPEDADIILSELHIGSFSPETFDVETFDDPIDNGSVKAYLRKNGTFDENTIFEIEANKKKQYFRNFRSFVRIVDETSQPTSFSFRNPPHFMSMVEAEARDAHYETDAVLDDYFYHPNTAPFLATYFIQRFGNSNPSPRYVKTVATAFKDGIYLNQFGTSQYGDLGAMVAAILLDREARSSVLNLDPSTGSLREPLLKLIAFMRSMELEAFAEYPELSLRGVAGKTGQMAHQIQTVFSFFLQDFTTEGPVKDANLVSPEGQRYQTPTIIGLLNGLYSMIKFGLSSCYGGFGEKLTNCNRRLDEGEFTHATAKLSYQPADPSDAEAVVNELALLLTAGRLNQESRNIIQQQYTNAGDIEAGVRLAQQLIVSSPEFHSTNYVEFSGEAREVPEPVEPTTNPFKAVTYLLLSGGVDSFNILVPHSDCAEKDMFVEYQTIRSKVALSKAELFKITTGGEPQVCNTFGIHQSLPILQELYEDGDALFFSNAGLLFEPVTKENWKSKTSTQLFAHNVQQRNIQQVDVFQEVAGTGILGRMADVLTKEGYNTGSFATSGDSTSLRGEPTKSPSIYSVGGDGIDAFNPKPSTDDMVSTIADINNLTKIDNSGYFGKTWSELLDQALIQTDTILGALDSIQTMETFPNTKLGNQMKTVSQVIQRHDTLNMDRQFFMAEMGGFDTHSKVNETLYEKLPEVNDALTSFVKEMKALGEWDNVILIMASDFGRTLTPNGGDGTDHAWGGNYFMIGGGLKGGRILGEYPSDLTANGPLVLKRGRVIPTTSWDAIMNGVAQWVGVDNDSDLNIVLPNRDKFGDDLFNINDLFESNRRRLRKTTKK